MVEISESQHLGADVDVDVNQNLKAREELWACGCNAHCQLVTSHSATSPEVNDLFEFQKIAGGESLRLFFASWSQIAFLVGPQLHIRGHRSEHTPRYSCADLIVSSTTDSVPVADLTSPFGDHNGLQGAISSKTGTLYLFSLPTSPESPSDSLPTPYLNPHSDPYPARLAAVSTNPTGTTSTVFLASPAASTIHLAIFPSASTLLAWYASPSSPDLVSRLQHHMLPGRFSQLATGATGFVLLTTAGELYTWGDGRYPQVLGRGVGEGWDRPGRVDALGGLVVKKVCAGGWVMGAVTEAGDAYLWGCWAPGRGEGGAPGRMEALGDGEGCEHGVVRVRLPGAEEDEALEVVDLAVGACHVLALDSQGRVWSAGSAEVGQLGVGLRESGASKLEVRWQLASLPVELWRMERRSVRSIACGDETSFVVVASDDAP